MGGRGLPGTKVTYQGIFRFRPLYKFLRQYLAEKGWVAAQGPPDINYEEKYIEKGDDSVVHVIYWKAKRPIESLPQGMAYMDMELRTVGVRNEEVMINNKKTRVENGEINFTITIRYEYDEKSLAKGPITKMLLRKYTEKFVDTEVDDVEKELVIDTIDFGNEIKYYFRMEGGSTEPGDTIDQRPEG